MSRHVFKVDAEDPVWFTGETAEQVEAFALAEGWAEPGDKVTQVADAEEFAVYFEGDGLYTKTAAEWAASGEGVRYLAGGRLD